MEGNEQTSSDLAAKIIVPIVAAFVLFSVVKFLLCAHIPLKQLPAACLGSGAGFAMSLKLATKKCCSYLLGRSTSSDRIFEAEKGARVKEWLEKSQHSTLSAPEMIAAVKVPSIGSCLNEMGPVDLEIGKVPISRQERESFGIHEAIECGTSGAQDAEGRNAASPSCTFSCQSVEVIAT